MHVGLSTQLEAAGITSQQPNQEDDHAQTTRWWKSWALTNEQNQDGYAVVAASEPEATRSGEAGMAACAAGGMVWPMRSALART